MPGEWKLELPPGGLVLPEMTLFHDQDQPIHTAPSVDATPLPPLWPPTGALPNDFVAASWFSSTPKGYSFELGARGAKPASVSWLKRSWHVETSCSVPLGRAGLKAMGWAELERLILSRVGRSIAPDQYLPTKGLYPPLWSSLTAHGHELRWPEIDRLHLAKEIRDRLQKAVDTEGIAADGMHDALRDILPSLNRCNERSGLLRVGCTFPKSSRRATALRIISPTEILPSEFACVRRVVEGASPPPSRICDVQVELIADPPHLRMGAYE